MPVLIPNTNGARDCVFRVNWFVVDCSDSDGRNGLNLKIVKGLSEKSWKEESMQ
jgi:hypothetical protein